MPLVERYSKAVCTEFKPTIKRQSATDGNVFHITTPENHSVKGNTTPPKSKESGSTSQKHETSSSDFKDVLASCKEFDGGVWGEVKSTVNFFNPIAWVARLLRMFSSRNVGGSTMACSSSGVRAKNIKENLRLVAKWIGGLTSDQGSLVYGHQHYSKIDRKERSILVDGKTYRGKTVFETTEISVYLTSGGDFIGVPRGLLLNKFNEGVMLFEADPGNLDLGELGTYKDIGALLDKIEPLNVNKFTNAENNKQRFKQFVEVNKRFAEFLTDKPAVMDSPLVMYDPGHLDATPSQLGSTARKLDYGTVRATSTSTVELNTRQLSPEPSDPSVQLYRSSSPESIDGDDQPLDGAQTPRSITGNSHILDEGYQTDKSVTPDDEPL